MTLAVTISDADRARYQAAREAEEARLEYGITVDDVRRLLKKAKTVDLWVRRDRDGGANIISISAAVARKSLKYSRGTEAMPCDFDPETKLLSIGMLRAIFNAEPR